MLIGKLSLFQIPPIVSCARESSDSVRHFTRCASGEDRWAWEQLDKDQNDLIKVEARPAVFRVLAAYSDHAHQSCHIATLIKERGKGRLDSEDVRCILTVSPRRAPGPLRKRSMNALSKAKV